MATEEASARRQWRWVYRFENQMFERVNQGLFGDGVIAPQDEDDVFALLRQGTNGRVGELFPAVMGMRGRLPSPYRQRGVQEDQRQVHALREDRGARQDEFIGTFVRQLLR